MRTKILDKKTIYEGSFLRFILASYQDAQGVRREWESFERINCDGVAAIVPVTGNKELILVKQFRPPVNRHVIEFPAGLNDKAESLENAARRELQEETGYTAEEMLFLADGPISSGSSGEILTVFLAKGLEYTGIGQRDETEDIEILKIPLHKIDAELQRLKSEGNLIDLKIFGFIELAKKKLAGSDKSSL